MERIKRERCHYCKIREEYRIIRIKRRELDGNIIWVCESCLFDREGYIP